jgi:hypothetical protein
MVLAGTPHLLFFPDHLVAVVEVAQASVTNQTLVLVVTEVMLAV